MYSTTKAQPDLSNPTTTKTLVAREPRNIQTKLYQSIYYSIFPISQIFVLHFPIAFLLAPSRLATTVTQLEANVTLLSRHQYLPHIFDLKLYFLCVFLSRPRPRFL